MNKSINKFLFAGDRFMHKLHLRHLRHLRHPGFTYSTCELFTKHPEKIQKFKETGNLKHIYKSEVDNMIPHILFAKIWLIELFQIKF